MENTTNSTPNTPNTLTDRETGTLQTGLNIIDYTFRNCKIGGQNSYYQKGYQLAFQRVWKKTHELLLKAGEGYEFRGGFYTAKIAQKGSPYINRLSAALNMFKDVETDDYNQMVDDSIQAQEAYLANKKAEKAEPPTEVGF